MCIKVANCNSAQAELWAKTTHTSLSISRTTPLPAAAERERSLLVLLRTALPDIQQFKDNIWKQVISKLRQS